MTGRSLRSFYPSPRVSLFSTLQAPTVVKKKMASRARHISQWEGWRTTLGFSPPQGARIPGKPSSTWARAPRPSRVQRKRPALKAAFQRYALPRLMKIPSSRDRRYMRGKKLAFHSQANLITPSLCWNLRLIPCLSPPSKLTTLLMNDLNMQLAQAATFFPSLTSSPIYIPHVSHNYHVQCVKADFEIL